MVGLHEARNRQLQGPRVNLSTTGPAIAREPEGGDPHTVSMRMLGAPEGSRCQSYPGHHDDRTQANTSKCTASETR